MTAQERRGWLLAITMMLCVLFTLGFFSSTSVFVPALLGYFGGSRAHISLIFTIEALVNAAVGTLAGWLLDRYDARWIISVGLIFAGAGFVVASQAHAFSTLMIAYVLFGIGAAAAAYVPATLVITNWLPNRRGLALAVALSGITLGASILVPVSAYVIRTAGWRWAYGMFALPTVAIMIPWVLKVIRSAPPDAMGRPAGHRKDDDSVPGLTVAEVLHGRSFWLLNLMFLCWGFMSGSQAFHLVPLLVSAGYTVAQSATAVSVMFAFAAVGKPLMGYLGDRLGVKLVLTLNLAGLAVAQFMLTHKPSPLAVDVYILLQGFLIPGAFVLVPVLEAEVFGLRRYGTISGLCAISSMLGVSCSAVVVGQIFDTYGTYGPAWAMLTAMGALAALVPYTIVPFTRLRAAQPVLAAAAH